MYLPRCNRIPEICGASICSYYLVLFEHITNVAGDAEALSALSHATLWMKRHVLKKGAHLGMNERSQGSPCLASFLRLVWVLCNCDKDARGSTEAISPAFVQSKCKFELSWQSVCLLMPVLCQPEDDFRFCKLGWVAGLKKRSFHCLGSISESVRTWLKPMGWGSGEEEVKGQQLVRSSLVRASLKIEKYNERIKAKSTPWSN